MTAAESLSFAVLEERDPSPPHSPLEEQYGRCLSFGSRLAVNFVESIDGATTFAEGDSKQIGLNSRPDRLLMAMLRASASVILVGASTFRASPAHQWTAENLLPDRAEELAELRRHVNGSDTPAPLLIVSSRGEIPADHAAVVNGEATVHVLTSKAGAEKLQDFPGLSVSVSESVAIGGNEILTKARSLGQGLILCEGGPHLFGDLLKDNVVDDLFLTVSPQLVGEGSGHKLVEGLAFHPQNTPQAELASARAHLDHLFLHYRFKV